MKKKPHKPIFFYTPRLVSVALLTVLSYFSFEAYMDAPSMTNSPFAVYLFPVFVLLIVTAISWKRARIGGTLFIIGGLFYAFGVNGMSSASLALVAAPLILIGVLFHLSQYFYEK